MCSAYHTSHAASGPGPELARYSHRPTCRGSVVKQRLTLPVALVAALSGNACQESNPVQPGPDQSEQSQSRARTPAQPETVPGQYIVVFSDAVTDPAGLARTLVAAQGGTLRHTYAAALKGFAAQLPDAAVAALRRNPMIAYVEQDQVVH